MRTQSRNNTASISFCLHYAISITALFLLLFPEVCSSQTQTQTQTPNSMDHRVVATGFNYKTNYTIPKNIKTPDSSIFGDITGLTYDPSREVYYALVDLRFYSLAMGSESSTVQSVTYLKGSNGVRFTLSDIQPKGIAYYNNKVYVAHEAGNNGIYDGGVWGYGLDGLKLAELPVPTYFDFSSASDGFQSVSVTPIGDRLVAATKVPLVRDTGTQTQLIRFTEYDISAGSNQIIAQYAYGATTELLDIVALDDSGSFLTLEENGALYYASRQDATNVNDVVSLDAQTSPTLISKSRIEDLLKGMDNSNDINYEAMAIQYESSLESDDFNFAALASSDNTTSTTALIAEITVDKSMKIVAAEIETESSSNDPIARDPAVWVNPEDPDYSLLFGTTPRDADTNTNANNMGLGVYNLNGTLLKKWTGSYYGVDIIYAFKMNDGSLIDVAVVTEGDNGRVKTFQINATSPYLIDITANGIGSIRTGAGSGAYDVATYTSVFTGKMYSFVVSGLDEITQIQLEDNGNGRVRKVRSVNRLIDVAVSSGESVQGMVVDKEIGRLYVSLGDRIIQLDAEPNEEDGNSYREVATASSFVTPSVAAPQLRGLTMYYAEYHEGYLIVSVHGQSTFAVFDRDEMDYIGSFTIGETEGNNSIDRTGNSKGIEVVNVNLGPDFECGAFIAQDEDNNPNSISNKNGNFKLVPFNAIADALSDEFEVDTTSWGPRRFALATWIDEMSMSVYNELKLQRISGRDTKVLLDYLAQAAYHLYPPATKLRQIMEPMNRVRGRTGRSSSDTESSSRRVLGSKHSSNSHNRRGRRRRARARCADTSSDRDGKNAKGYKALRFFIDELNDLKADERLEVPATTYQYWLKLARQIRAHVPADLDFD